MRKVLLPAFGSVTAKTRIVLPESTPGTIFRFISSLPFLRMHAVSMHVTSIRLGEKPSAQMSSNASVSASSPVLLPPYSSGTRHPNSPRFANSFHSS